MVIIFLPVSKAQHGCIDCLALMLCAELQAQESITNYASGKIMTFGYEFHFGLCKELSPLVESRMWLLLKYVDYTSGVSVVSYVIGHLIHDKKDLNPASELDSSNYAFASTVPLPFRLCMANVLISACQKISSSCTSQFAARVLPSLLHSVEVVQHTSI